MGRTIRVLIGFAAACLAAAYTKLFFAYTPAEIMNLPSDVAFDRFLDIVEHGWKYAIPFAIVGLSLAEFRGVRSWTYYAIVALAVALLAFVVQAQGEARGAATVVNNYAFAAYLTTGLMAGLFYWLVAGRFAGGPGPVVTNADVGKPATPKTAPGADKPKVSTEAPKPATGGAAAKTTVVATPATGAAKKS